MTRTSITTLLLGAGLVLAGCGGAGGDRGDSAEGGEGGSAAYATEDAVVLEVQPYGGCQRLAGDDGGCGPLERFDVEHAGPELVDAVVAADLDALLAATPGPCAAAVDGVSYEFTVHPPDAPAVTFDTCGVDLAASDQELARLLVERYGTG